MAFVLIPHLDPTHESLMVDLLSKQTTMPVSEARDGVQVERNHVYVIPPNADLTIEHRVLRVVSPPARRVSHTAIDVFLGSLAADQQARAIGIILSGTGSQGSLGMKAIKAAGGLVVAQAPESAEHDQMPRNAIATGVVDLVLPPEEMPKALLRHPAEPVAPAGDVVPEDLAQIVLLLRTQTKRDFRGYRWHMLMRRVRRRMASCHLERVAAYIDYLRAHPDEGQALAKDLSIGVTAFFREPEAFQVLERVVIPDLVQRSRGTDGERPVRVWVPGCATGEEAYSIAILFLEQFAVAKQPVTLQVFATDVDDESLDVARAGLYPDSIAADLSAERLRHFFVKADGHRYQVSKLLREVITFAPQNLISDAPFSKLDLIACRNVLIYLEPMAPELRNDLGGHMTGIGLLAQTLQGELAKAGSPLTARTQELVESISDAQQHLRSVVRGLMPVEAIPEGLMVALDALAKQCTAASGITCRFACEPPVHVEDAGTAVHLFRIAQEAMHNVVRHAEATQIGVSLRRTAQRLEIVVTDDGRGLGDIPDGHSGMGLVSMHQRARLLGGDCSIEPSDGRGTVVLCWVPSPERSGRETRALPPTTGDRLIGSSKTTPQSTE